MFLLLAIGVSSGAWFYSLSKSNFFFSGATILVLCKSAILGECVFVLFFRYIVLYIVLICCSVNIILSFLGYLTVFVCGVSLGSFISCGLNIDILGGIIIFIIQLIYCIIIMYLNAINTISNGFLVPAKGMLGRKAKIYISVFAFLILFVFVSGLMIFFLNTYFLN